MPPEECSQEAPVLRGFFTPEMSNIVRQAEDLVNAMEDIPWVAYHREDDDCKKTFDTLYRLLCDFIDR